MLKFFWNSGILLAATMAFLFSLDSLVTAKVSETVPIFEYAVAGGVIKWAITLVINTASRESIFGRREDLHLLIPTGFCFGGFLICLYGALGLLGLVEAVGLFYMNPVLSAIIGRLAFKDPFGPPSILGLALVVWGVGLVNGSSFWFALKDVTWDLERIIGTILGACSALFAAMAFAATRGLGDRVAAGTISTWAFIAQTVLGIPPMLIGYPSRMVVVSDIFTIAIIVMGSLAACIGEVFVC
ncbi:hypothetical protein BSKO_06804 [Bryopsis sp. KO-2023]|nr:hypothetical protein BSKO_06804 [Bryopsis sp. KO-2023]